jgi:hypothetical protein
MQFLGEILGKVERKYFYHQAKEERKGREGGGGGPSLSNFNRNVWEWIKCNFCECNWECIMRLRRREGKGEGGYSMLSKIWVG